MIRVRHKFYKGDFAYYIDKNNNVVGDVVKKHFADEQTREVKYLISGHILPESALYAVRLEAEEQVKLNKGENDGILL